MKSLKNLFLENKYFLIVLLIVLIVFNKLFIPAPLTWIDGSYWFPEKVASFFSWPYLPHFNYWNQPLSFVYQFPLYFMQAFLIVIFNMDYLIIQRLFYYLLAPILSAFSMYLLSNEFFKDKKIASLSSFFYACNQYFFGHIIRGQRGLFVGYALLPLVIYLFIKSYKKRKYLLLCALSISALVIYDLRVAFLALLVMIFYSIYNFRKIKKSISNLLIICFIFLLINLYWIVPFISNLNNPLLSKVSGLSYLYSENTGLSVQPIFSLLFVDVWTIECFSGFNCLDVSFEEYPPFSIVAPFFVILPVFLFLIFERKFNKKFLFLLIGYLTFSFLSKGLFKPFDYLFLFLYAYIPPFMFFRRPEKFINAALIFVSILSSYSIFYFIKKYKAHGKILLVSILLFQLFIIIPFSITGLGGASEPTSLPESYVNINRLFINDAESYSFLRFPYWKYNFVYGPTFVLGDAEHEEISFSNSLDESFSDYYLRHGGGSYGGLVYSEKINFTNLPYLLGLLNIKYVVLDANPERYELYKINSEIPAGFFESILDKQEGLHKVSENLYENEFYMPKFYSVNEVYLIDSGLADIKGFNIISNLSYHENLSSVALFFTDDLSQSDLDLIIPYITRFYVSAGKSLIDDPFIGVLTFNFSDITSHNVSSFNFSSVNRSLFNLTVSDGSILVKVLINEPISNTSSFGFIEVNPSLYNITGFKDNILIFADKYDENWCVDDQCSLKTALGSNAFIINKTDFELQYKWQSTFDVLFIFSLICFIGFIILTLYLFACH